MKFKINVISVKWPNYKEDMNVIILYTSDTKASRATYFKNVPR